jgi:penicillin amidase
VRRILFGVNVLIALAAISAAGVYYWVFCRPLPQSSGTIETLVSQPVEVDRDARGVPHIRAKSLEDALFTEGYTVASDRMWQMDTLRRLASGELSEILGSATLEFDREARRMRLRRTAEQMYSALSPEERKPFEAYARGVNAYIESHRGRYSFEFTLLRYDPRPWSVKDSLLVALQMFRTLTNDWRTKLIKEQMLRSGERDKVDFLFPTRSGLEISPGGDLYPGSNAWAVSGSHTASGKPLLSSDAHLEFSLPGIWHMTHIQSPGMNVAGLELPGVPGVIIGHNDRIAWGVTNLGFDVQELYAERIDLRTGQYVFQNHLELARRERELIAIKGQAPEQLDVLVTRHGPVFTSESGRVLTLKWSAFDVSIFHNVFLEIDQARNWQDFRAALARFGGPGQNFVYADVDGNIGYQAAGRLPIRRNYKGDVPVDGAEGLNEWEGYIPFEELPHAFNPPNGFIVTANQNPFPESFPYRVGGHFAAPYRSGQILNMLKAGGSKLRPDDSLRIQKDVYSGFHKFLARQVAAAYEKRGDNNPLFSAAIPTLKTWDGQMDKDRPEPFLADLLYQYVRKAVAERASPGSGPGYEAENVNLASASVERLLRERPRDWFTDYDQLLLRCLTDAVEEGQRIQGSDPKKWRWGKVTFLEVSNPVGARVPIIGKYFNIGPVPMSGGAFTVKQTKGKLGPSERMNVSVGNWDDSLLNLPIGESGHFASSHYKDEWEAYYSGRSFPMEFSKVDVKSSVQFVPADGVTVTTPRPAMAAGGVNTEEYKETDLPFNSIDVKAGGYRERVEENHTIVATCSGFSLAALRLGDRDIPLKANAVSSQCMIETKDYGNLRLKMNTATLSAYILVTPKQEELFRKLLPATRK